MGAIRKEMSSTVKQELIETVERIGGWLEERGLGGLVPQEVLLLERAKAEIGYPPKEKVSND